MQKILLYFALKYKGDWNKIYQALEAKEKMSVEDLVKATDNVGCKWTTIISPEYMQKLTHTYKPPFVLFYTGDLSILSNENEIRSSLTPNRHHSLEGISKTRNGIKSFEILNKGLLNYMQEVDLNSSDLIVSESYDGFGLADPAIANEQLKIVSALSNSIVMEEYNEVVVELINDYRVSDKYNRPFKIFVKEDVKGKSFEEKNVFNLSEAKTFGEKDKSSKKK